jgi:signal peptidase I
VIVGGSVILGALIVAASVLTLNRGSAPPSGETSSQGKETASPRPSELVLTVRGVNMDPTLRSGQQIDVDPNAYVGQEPGDGDIVVFRDPNPGASSDQTAFVDRVIATGGQTIEVRVNADGVAIVYVNGQLLSEPYLGPVKETRPFGPVEVPEGKLFVMGDNRTNSNDSRYGLGFVPINKVIGKVIGTD